VLQTLDIVDVAPGGEGVARAASGRAVFVPFTARGDRVVADVPGGVGPAHAALIELVAPGPGRVAPPCRHFGPASAAVDDERGCGGCEWLHLGTGLQLEAKQRGFVETLRRVGGVAAEDLALRPIVGSPRPLRYRARAKFHFDRPSARLVFFRRRSHHPVRLVECHLLEPALDALRAELGPALAGSGLDVREATLEWSAHEGRGSAYLRLGASRATARERAERLLDAVPALKGAVLGAEGAPLQQVGDPVLRLERRPGDPEAGLQSSRPDVFQQANRAANALLVDAALDLLRPDGEDVLELFCGAGNFTAALARRARTLHAVEGQGPSIDLARRDVGSSNVRFIAGDAMALARALGRERGPRATRFGAVLLDPPREGARGLGAALRDLGRPRAVYVSCDPATLARDVKGCREAGYRVAAAQPVDMFPQTHHVEGVVLLEPAS
jgi:23S rRNA (uracil1939-C5)-methyltransferase